MAKLQELVEMLTPDVIQNIEYRASMNQSPSEIAAALSLNRRNFLHLWRTPESIVRVAYDRGRAIMEGNKNEELTKLMLSGNVTAMQIHDKKTRVRKFEDIKNEIFSFE